MTRFLHLERSPTQRVNQRRHRPCILATASGSGHVPAWDRVAAFAVFWLLLLLTVAAGAQAVGTAADAPRLALVIGNDQYKTLSRLPTSANDARDVAKALEALDFKVTTQIDADLQTMNSAFSAFLQQLREPANRDAIAVFYFAGHGLQYKSHNFMLPTDFDINRGQNELQQQALWLDKQITREMSRTRAGGSNVVILEASRENPFGDAPGLAQIDIENNLPERTLVMFAAAPGKASADKVDERAPERNDIFTRELVKQLQKVGPSMDLDGFFGVVQNEVSSANRAQQPRKMANLASKTLLAKAGAAGGAVAGSEDFKLWQAVESSPDLCSFEHYLAQYPEGESAALARAKVKTIKDRQAAQAKVMADPALGFTQAQIDAVLAEQAKAAARCIAKYGTKRAAAPVPRTIARALRVEPWRHPAVDRGSRSIEAGMALQRVAFRIGGAEPAGGNLRRAPARGHGEPAHGMDPGGVFRVAQAAPGGDDRPQGAGDTEFRAALLKAEQGDVDAMYLVAVMYGRGSNGVAVNKGEMLRWLAVSSALGNGLASYRLYKFYNDERRSQLEAVKFRHLAKQQGYDGPPGLSIQR